MHSVWLCELLMIDFLQNTVVLRPAERLSCRRNITGLSLTWCVGDAVNTSLVDAGTPLGTTAVVTPGSAGYLLSECCILASL